LPPDSAPEPRGDRLAPHVAAVLAAIAACYANGLTGPFLLDDPAPGAPLVRSSRRLIAWSFELNRRVSGGETWSYHLLNVLVHAAAALALLGVLRRSLALADPAGDGRRGARLALVVTLLWAVHPLGTSAVSYLSQRAECLAALAVLATLYGALRARTSPSPRRWMVLALVGLALGFGLKETVAAAPPLLWLGELVLAPGAPARTGCASRRRFHLALLGLWALLAARFVLPLLFAPDASAGFRMRDGMGPLAYARSQPGVILHYLRLALWPDPLVFDYAWPVARGPADWVPATAVLALLVAAGVVLLLRRSPLAFPALGFFLLLAPSSSIVPIRDLAFEHRMYLPLACVLALAALAARAVCARWLPWATHAPAALALLALAALGATTVRRNRDYATALDLWRSTVAHAPENPRARNALAVALMDLGRSEEAEQELRRTLALDPEHANARRNLGVLAAGRGNYGAAIWYLQRSLELADSPTAREDLARLFTLTGRPAEAEAELVRSVALRRERARGWDDPRLGPAQLELARLLAARGACAEALPYLAGALALAPEVAEEHWLLGRCLAATGRPEEAHAAFRAALRLDPGSAEARAGLERLESERRAAPPADGAIPR
jgi:Flp pilus assembly protein TadD